MLCLYASLVLNVREIRPFGSDRGWAGKITGPSYPYRVHWVVDLCGARKLCFRSQARPALGCLRVKPPAGFEPAGGYGEGHMVPAPFSKESIHY